jgi:hypothetical protein
MFAKSLTEGQDGMQRRLRTASSNARDNVSEQNCLRKLQWGTAKLVHPACVFLGPRKNAAIHLKTGPQDM